MQGQVNIPEVIYKNLFFSTALFLIGYSANAQKFSIGPAIGVHAYTVAFHNVEEKSQFDAKGKLGYKGGVYIAFPLENNFSWAVEGYYSKKGRKVSFYEGKNTNDASYNFLEISALLRKSYDIAIAKNIPGTFFFNVGPNINYWMSGKGKLDATVDLDYKVKFQESDGTIRENAITNANRWLYGLEAGAGIETRLTKKQYVQFEFRFTYGHTYLGGQDSSEIPILHFEDSLRSNYRVLSVILRYGIDFDMRLAKKGKSTYKRK